MLTRESVEPVLKSLMTEHDSCEWDPVFGQETLCELYTVTKVIDQWTIAVRLAGNNEDLSPRMAGRFQWHSSSHPVTVE